ncbi:fumarylacetoacetate hydrolase family protein [Lysobacter sp. SG-8]|uniref:Fumarylacetoacetate hydrolase family protein n=1 Tax=Marilutibacter penaei TaxID=2759900 RepID=A0A7W3U3I5_9GAMM|nr:fumarylacetoacetate hydrolase family protein [Lysobacter penaei]MBB1088258.1 fumarylacetoacetate hydrolase family protein [Lysobacter penaei]
MGDVIQPPAPTRIPVFADGRDTGDRFPVRRVYCVGRNFADHAREMGASAPTDPSRRGQPTLFLKPADAIVNGGDVHYPPGTSDLHHEVELVVALGEDAPPEPLSAEAAARLVFGYALGLDLTRRDLQAAAKAKGLPWDTGKSFDEAAPVGPLVHATRAGPLAGRRLSLDVNGTTRQQGSLDDMIWSVTDILQSLSTLYALRAGDLVFMGTPAGVGPLQSGDHYEARLDGLPPLKGRILPPR